MNLDLGLEELLVKDNKIFNYKIGRLGYPIIPVDPDVLLGHFGIEHFEKHILEYYKRN